MKPVLAPLNISPGFSTATRKVLTLEIDTGTDELRDVRDEATAHPT
jgi:hypothetical protein